MCGRYVLHLRPSEVRQRLADQDMPVDEAPSDDEPRLRSSYNFAPGYHGLIYRAATNDRGTDATPLEDDPTSTVPTTTTAAEHNDDNDDDDHQPSRKKAKLAHSTSVHPQIDGLSTRETKYKLQSAKWGLIPFWTKRPPDYPSMLRTINCRDDSLAQSGGMWTTMKQRKRCIVVAEGFYEWLKKNNGKDRVPHFVRRRDGALMCMAGLWDCVKYEAEEKDEGEEEEGKEADGGEEGKEGKRKREGEGEKLYTYTIITTDSNKQLTFLHDRMPVILEPGSEEMRMWLDPSNIGWNKELQAMLKPFKGELDCYQVDKEVGKVGNNSPNFVIPIDSKDNKKNIANFFSGAQKVSPKKPTGNTASSSEIKQDPTEHRATSSKLIDPESNAPLPIPKPASQSSDSLSQAIKRDADTVPDEIIIQAADESTDRNIKREEDELGDADLLEAEKSPPRHVWSSPSKAKSPVSTRGGSAVKGDEKEDREKDGEGWLPSTPSKTRSATRNNPVTKTPTKSPGGGNKKITAFFGGK